MKKDAYYFKHDSNARHDPKMKAVLRKYGAKGYGWYWILIENLRDASGYKLEYNAFVLESLAEDMRCSIKDVQSFIDFLCSKELRLFCRSDEGDKNIVESQPVYFYSMSLIQRMHHLDEIRQKRAEAGRQRWGGRDD